MRNILAIGALLAISTSLFAQSAVYHQWDTDIEQALQKLRSAPSVATGEASEDDVAAQIDEEMPERYLFVYFAGTDWCPWCARFEREIISTPTFQRFMRERLVPVLIDFPRTRTLPPEQQAYNRLVAQHYEVSGFPTVVLLDPEGEVVLTTGYEGNGANLFIRNLRRTINAQ